MIDILYGHIEIVSTSRREGDQLLLGGYAIHYDGDGKETHRTPDRVNVVMTFPKGMAESEKAALTHAATSTRCAKGD